MNDVYAKIAQHYGGLYRPEFEHDSCGVGLIASVKGEKSHKILRLAIESVCNLQHRGAVDADRITGDGAGVTFQIPHKIFRAEIEKQGGRLYEDTDLGVGVVYLPMEEYRKGHAKRIVEQVMNGRGLHFFGWREVPTNVNVLGFKARTTLPAIEQFMVGKKGGISQEEFERKLYLARKEVETRVWEDEIDEVYIPSCSSQTISYKAFLVSRSLEKFYDDLRNPEFETALALYHQRYSTNTFPTWSLSQPFRMLAHNGEINTVRGNRNWMRAREAEFDNDCWDPADLKWLRTVKIAARSDSASLDRALEILTLSGRSILHAMTLLVPPAWRSDPDINDELAAFYEYQRCFSEPWDGPAALAFTDGRYAAACLDRNGLRPARYKLNSEGIFHLGSEVGLIPMDDAKVIQKGRLAPGEMIAVDTVGQKVLYDRDIKQELASRHPFRKWINEKLIRLSSLKLPAPVEPTEPLDIMGLSQKQVTFGCTSEELKIILKPMSETGMEGSGSMGDDTPHAPLSKQPKILYHYFKQLFAQVTNPPIDPIRERLVMSLHTMLGWRRNMLVETSDHVELIEINSPVLLPAEFEALQNMPAPHAAATLNATFPAADGEGGLRPGLDALCMAAEKAVDAGARLLILSDRAVDHNNVPIPMLMATGAVHHHLTDVGKRMRASIICDTGDGREVQQIACLVGYGASAVHPYLAYESIRELLEKELAEGVDYAHAVENFRKAIDKGLLKIMSKMGISVLDSYRGAEIFEALGIAHEVIERCFPHTISQIGGVGFKEIARETLVRHTQAYGQPVPEDASSMELDNPGYFKFRRGGETHGFHAGVIKNFHKFVKTADPADYKAYVASVLETDPVNLRDLMEFVPAETGPIPLEEVEPIEGIRKRFTTAAMSLGALSPEAHEALAIAMNRIGGKSNSGEGGEDPKRFHRDANGDWRNSAIKQVASGRFGVKASYLASAKEIEIKMAQGAKPGEGGQLPAFKVSGIIAKLRCTAEGVELISPPPHHDIYSIEDLAQLIYDLKQVNRRARICVKLVAESGVGTIAAGVAKAHADVILISGHDGGTGAAPISSIKHAGGPWELGLSESHQILMINGLRNRVTLRTDGGMRTGRDIVIAAILGAEQFNFGTSALIALFCVYARQCHLNNCPVGVATQDPKYRAKFKGSPDNVVNFFNGVAQEVREIMASLGVRRLNDLIGRPEYLKQRIVPEHDKANCLDLSGILKDVAKDPGIVQRLLAGARSDQPDDQISDEQIIRDSDIERYCTHPRNELVDDYPLDETILQDAADIISGGGQVTLEYDVNSVNRSIGTQLSGQIAYLGFTKGLDGLPEGSNINLKLRGSAGQSLGAFLCPGVHIHLVGEANDYVGKGMSGGEIIVQAPKVRGFVPHENVIVGNTIMYGATAGNVYINGMAGERTAVRNSGCIAVVEGVGDHGCEYMTNGTVVILGSTGKNFGAGMTGGTAYVLDLNDRFSKLYNDEKIKLERLEDQDDISFLQGLILKHLEKTDSERADEVLKHWHTYLPKFWKVVPKSQPPKQADNVETDMGTGEVKEDQAVPVAVK